MEGRVIATLVVAGILGLTAIVLAFVGEATRIKVVYSDAGYCYYTNSPAMALGIFAALLVLIEQIIVSVGVGCFCCRRAGCPRACGGICGVICFIFSWVAFVGSFSSLISAACLNNMHYLIALGNDSNLCPVATPGVFAGAGVLCIISVTLGLISYRTSVYSSDKGSVATSPGFVGQDKSNQHGVAMMAQPQMPPQQLV